MCSDDRHECDLTIEIIMYRKCERMCLENIKGQSTKDSWKIVGKPWYIL